MKKIYLFLPILLLSCASSFGQVSIKDSSIATPMISASYGYYLSAGDMAERFGNNSALQLNFDYKTKYNWIIGINGTYIFGNKVKDNMFDSINTSSGDHIGEEGELGDIRLFERGFTVSATIGRLIPLGKKPNPNSGIRLDLGLGFMQHKIRIETIGNNVPQLSKQYRKGYDRLSNGFLLTESIGYLYLSNNRLVNIYIGLECMQGFTQNRRSYDFMTMKKDTEKRVDILYGARLAWILPLYKKAPQEFYIN